MIRRTPLLLTGVLTLLGCSGSEERQRATPGDAVTRVAALLSPGKWRSKVTFEEMSFPGVPPEVARQMQGFAGQTQTGDSCLTKEEAARPPEDFFGGGEGCTYREFAMAGGKIDATLTCQQNGQAQTLTMVGTYGADDYAARMTLSGGGERAPTMKMRVAAKRIGEC